MNRSTLQVASGALALALSPSLPAGEAVPAAPLPPPPPPPPPPASTTLLNDWLRDQSDAFNRWDLGGQGRARYEVRENFGVAPGTDFRAEGVDNDNAYLLLRLKEHVGYQPVDWFRIFIEGRTSASMEDERNPNPEADNPIDFHQLHVVVGDPKRFPVNAKVGRQELSYGDERLIGAFDWNNLGRVFDAAKVRFENEDFWVDAFTGRVVLADNHNLNVANDYDWFSGAYASTRRLIPQQESQLYFLARNTGTGSPTATTGSPQAGGPPPRDIYTIGARIKSLPGSLGAWDYSLEAAGQFGRFKDSVNGPSLDHQAFAVHLGGGHTFADCPATPRVGLEYNFASGDSDPADGDHGTFENLFPTNHKFYGYMDVASWQNLHNPRLTLSMKPVKDLVVSLDVHGFWLADTGDSFYTAAGGRRGGVGPTAGTGYGINEGYDPYVGSEIDLVATYSFRNIGSLQAGYGHFFAGSYLDSTWSNVGGATDADFVYGQVVLSF